MSLVFAGITPHPPTLLSTIGGDATEDVKGTRAALERLEQDLYVARPHLVIILSPHTGKFPHTFTVNGHTHFESSFGVFGDLATKQQWTGAPTLAAIIQRTVTDNSSLTVRLVSDPHVDHSVSIPLMFLMTHLTEVPILPIGFSDLSPADHLRFGEVLKDVIMASDKRIAVLISGDMSHCHKTDGPGGFHKDAAVFDETVIRCLETRNTAGLTQLDPTVVSNAQECLYRPLLIALGLLKNVSTSFENYSYQKPHGVGYLVGNFHLA